MLYFLLTVIGLPVIIICLLQIGAVQNYAADRITDYLSDELKTEIKIGSVSISFFLDVVLEDVEIRDQHKNTLIKAEEINVGANSFFSSRKVISIGNVTIENAVINLIKYKGEKDFNYKFISEYFSSSDTTTIKSGKSLKIWIGSLKLVNTVFKFKDENKEPQEKGVNFDDLELTAINAGINKLSIVEDTLYADIRSLSCKDKCGFELKSFSGLARISPDGIDVMNLRIETPGTMLSVNLKFDYKCYDDFNDFIEKVNITALFKPSKINIKDIGYFAPELLSAENSINIAGEIKGKISNLKGKNFRFLYGKSTYFNGNFNVSGLPVVENTYMHFNIRNFSTSQSDLKSFNIPSSNTQHLDLPPELVKLGNVRFKGVFTGFYNDFVANGDLYTDRGNVSTDIILKRNKTTNLIDYSGKIATTNLNLGEIFDMKGGLGNVSLNANVAGSGFDANSASVKVNGIINTVDIRNYHYRNISIKGDLAKKKFNGYLKIDDENLKLDFNGMVDYSKELPSFNVVSKIENLKLTKLHFLELTGDSLSSLSTELKLNFEGNTIDNIQGSIYADNTFFTYKGKMYSLKSFVFSNTANKNGNKTLKLNSDYANADISGNFMFNDLYLSSLKFIKEYLPSYSSWIKENPDSIPEQNFVYFIKLKNTEALSRLFLPELTVSANTVLKGTYNTKKSLLDLNITSALAKYQDIKLKNFFISGKTVDSKIKVNVGCDQFSLSDSMGLDDVVLNCVTRNDSINYRLSWENYSDKIKNSGNIRGFLSFSQRPHIELQFLEAKLVINDTAWNIARGNRFLFDSTNIAINNLVISTASQKLKINGTISENPAEKLHVNFRNFNVADLDMLNLTPGVEFDGFLCGDVEVSNIYKALTIVANDTIYDFSVNNERLGKAIFLSKWDKFNKAAAVNVDILYEGSSGTNKPVSVSGYYYPEREKDNFDLDIKLTNFKLVLLEKYLESFSSNFKGYASGKLKLEGTTAEPDLNGHLFLMVKAIQIDYLNENYSFTDSVFVAKNSFTFNHVVLNDINGDSAILDGKITHRNFNSMKIDLAVKPYNFQVLNTNVAQNNLFYGKANVTGIVTIMGPVNNIDINVVAKTEKNTSIFIPVSGDSEISDYNFIRFVGRKKKTEKFDNYNADISGLTMDFSLDITPDANIQIIFDSKIGDIIKARGSGNLNMEITTLGDFNMYGDYVIDEGDYLFTLKNIVSKKFDILKGSSLKWNGSPFNAISNITAVYPVKAALIDLLAASASGEDTSLYKKRADVNCLLKLTDKIFNPIISFDIELPKSDEKTKTNVKSIINNEEAMNRQIFSLLIVGRFTLPDKLPDVSINEGLGSTAYELLSNQLSNWLSQISKKVDIGVNYRQGTPITSELLETAISTQVFNGRVSIDGVIGVMGSQQGQSGAGNASNIVGDVNIEYKLTDDGKWLIRGFNKSNTVDLLNNSAPYTQGLGIFYRKEFDNFKDFFGKKEK